MADDNEKIQGLFARIIRRLGLEQRLDAIKRRLTFTSTGLIVSVVLVVVAIVFITQAIASSNFGSYVVLAFSDSLAISRHFPTYAMSVSESMPGFRLGLGLLFVGTLLILVRLAVNYFDQIRAILKNIKNNKHE